MEKHCKELAELLKYLTPNKVIYKSKNNNRYHFKEYKNGRLYFDIPNSITPKKPNIKSITVEQFCKLLLELFKKKILRTNDFPFKDCRIAGLYGFINVLYPDTFIKTHGKISLIKNK